MRKTLTAEQIRRRDERKAKLAAIVKHVAEMSDVERLALAARINITNTDGHTLSPRNQLLIALQIGTGATIVAGFRQWIKQGRCVKKGEHGASILFPRNPSDKTAEGEHSTQDRVYFLSGTVFDISQTEPLPSSDEENPPNQEWQPGHEAPYVSPGLIETAPLGPVGPPTSPAQELALI